MKNVLQLLNSTFAPKANQVDQIQHVHIQFHMSMNVFVT